MHCCNYMWPFLWCSFLKSRPNMEEFLQSLLQFQHFRQFLNSRIDAITKCSQKEKDVFDSELFTYEEGLSALSHSYSLHGLYMFFSLPF